LKSSDTCIEATKIYPGAPNAQKNLGIAYAGLDERHETVRARLTAEDRHRAQQN